MSDNEHTASVEPITPPLPLAEGAGEPASAAAAALEDDDEQPLPVHGKGDPERTCIISGRKGSRDELIRLALGPDGSVAPDVRAKAPGRGAWIGVDRATLEQAIAKGRLGKALARAFKTAVTVPVDLADQIEKALERAALDRLGLEARAGALLTGSERIVDAARKGSVDLLLHARDAAADGSRRLDQALRVGLGTEGSGEQGLVIPATRAILSMALGRENVVHLALIAPAAAARVSHALGRWRGFIGRDDLGRDGGP
ncbi:DUF448 domain-containing protein [Sphingomonas sp. BIUV-7]|uniref:DUF448 domain-containing protein n=1 Tax=Sphingomonas natans TaxID=3063330 RepID=A0ABT8Y5N3_9SPHN|nr:DUF448 domain-containing protein [Sphingomonas sp. BIUV-7]MDO6413630.1 DUF448 domain-containing protein [Sphingomonas sp. BIUV-7]